MTREELNGMRAVDVTTDAALIGVVASGHSWVELSDEDGGLTREQSGSAETTFVVAGPGHFVLTTDGRLEKVDVEAHEPPAQFAALTALRLSSDAPDEHAVDGVGEIPADGTSSCAITVEKVGTDGRRVTAGGGEVFVRTTGGTLTDDAGKPVRRLALKRGRARFRLVAEPTPKIVTVEVLGSPALAPAELRIEFV